MSENHPQAELIPLMLYGELSRQEERELQEHARVCPECAQELADLEDSLRTYRETREAPSLSPEMRARILRQAASNLKIVRVQRWLTPLRSRTALAAAATVLVAIGATIVVWRHGAPELANVATMPEAPAQEAKATDAVVTESQVVPKRDEAVGKDELLRSREDVADEVEPKQLGLEESVPASPIDRRKSESGETAGGRAVPGGIAPPESEANEGRLASANVPDEKKKEAGAVGGGAKIADMEYAPAPVPAVAPPVESEQATMMQRQVAEPGAPQKSAVEQDKDLPAATAKRAGFSADDDEQMSKKLKEAAELLKRGQRKQAVSIYRDLLKAYPEKRKEILAAVQEKSVADELEQR